MFSKLMEKQLILSMRLDRGRFLLPRFLGKLIGILPVWYSRRIERAFSHTLINSCFSILLLHFKGLKVLFEGVKKFIYCGAAFGVFPGFLLPHIGKVGPYCIAAFPFIYAKRTAKGLFAYYIALGGGLGVYG